MTNMLVLCITYFMGMSVLWEVLQRDYDSTLMKGEALRVLLIVPERYFLIVATGMDPYVKRFVVKKARR